MRLKSMKPIALKSYLRHTSLGLHTIFSGIKCLTKVINGLKKAEKILKRLINAPKYIVMADKSPLEFR